MRRILPLLAAVALALAPLAAAQQKADPEQEKAVAEGVVEAQVDELMKGNSTPQQLAQASNERFGTRFKAADFDPEQRAVASEDGEETGEPARLAPRHIRRGMHRC